MSQIINNNASAQDMSGVLKTMLHDVSDPNAASVSNSELPPELRSASSSKAGIALRVVGGILTAGISEGIRAIVHSVRSHSLGKDAAALLKADPHTRQVDYDSAAASLMRMTPKRAYGILKHMDRNDAIGIGVRMLDQMNGADPKKAAYTVSWLTPQSAVDVLDGLDPETSESIMNDIFRGIPNGNPGAANRILSGMDPLKAASFMLNKLAPDEIFAALRSIPHQKAAAILEQFDQASSSHISYDASEDDFTPQYGALLTRLDCENKAMDEDFRLSDAMSAAMLSEDPESGADIVGLRNGASLERTLANMPERELPNAMTALLKQYPERMGQCFAGWEKGHPYLGSIGNDVLESVFPHVNIITGSVLLEKMPAEKAAQLLDAMPKGVEANYLKNLHSTGRRDSEYGILARLGTEKAASFIKKAEPDVAAKILEGTMGKSSPKVVIDILKALGDKALSERIQHSMSVAAAKAISAYVTKSITGEV